MARERQQERGKEQVSPEELRALTGPSGIPPVRQAPGTAAPWQASLGQAPTPSRAGRRQQARAQRRRRALAMAVAVLLTGVVAVVLWQAWSRWGFGR